MKNEISEQVFIKKGKKQGKTIAIFGGIHGNERVGVEMINKLRGELEIDAGTVYLAYGNIPAIKKGVRCGKKNLNRCFISGNKGNTYEDKRAIELMQILDKCDALLDLHSFTNSKGEAFAISEKTGFDIVKQFDVNVISFGWGNVEPGGTDDYMHNQGKIGICLECGPHHKLEESLRRADLAVDVFLKYFGCIEGNELNVTKKKRYICVHKAIIRKTKDFIFNKEYKNFDLLSDGEIFATDNGKKYVAKKNECIILPTPNEPIGGEICLLGKEVKSNS